MSTPAASTDGPAAARPGMPVAVRVAGIFGSILAAVGVVALIVVLNVKYGSLARPTNPLAPDVTVSGLKLPGFTLTDQDGRPFTRDRLSGQVTIVDFMFTNCPFICPLLSARMVQAGEQLAGTPVRFLSVSVDPTHDTPARLREYGERYRANFSRWTFATGDAATVKRIVSDSLKFNLEDEPQTPITLPDGSTMSNISHPQHLVLVGPSGEVLGMYAAKDDAQVAALIDRARRAADEVARRRGL
ncbi:MAG: SCO family protein [Phycisphaerae bacterium]|nr:SCO family protein [Phycisphaerae bacterium]